MGRLVVVLQQPFHGQAPTLVANSGHQLAPLLAQTFRDACQLFQIEGQIATRKTVLMLEEPLASIPTRPGTAPTASSSSVLVTKYGYDSTTGRQDQVTDPIGKISKTYYDAAGRTTYVVDNYADFNASTEANSGGGTNGDQDQVVKTIYNAAGQVTELVALDRTGDVIKRLGWLSRPARYRFFRLQVE
ncbi:MAG: hypothetical protein U0795_13015 [Pirellulales bacterium]